MQVGFYINQITLNLCKPTFLDKNAQRGENFVGDNSLNSKSLIGRKQNVSPAHHKTNNNS